MSTRATVSLTMIVRDEQDNLPALLESVRGLFAETVVVDTGSADATKAVARRCGARVFDFPWCDDFSAARNESLRHATGEFACWLDADNRVDAENREKLLALLASLRPGDRSAYAMRQRSPLPDGGVSELHYVRLFPRAPARWEGVCHEQVLPSLTRAGCTPRATDVRIDHLGYRDGAALAAKLDRNLRILLAQRAKHPEDCWATFHLGRHYHSVGRHAEAVPLLEAAVGLLPRGSVEELDLLAQAHILLTLSYGAVGQIGKALQACRAARRLAPWRHRDAITEGDILRDLGDRAGAERAYREALAGEPANPVAAARLASLGVRGG